MSRITAAERYNQRRQDILSQEINIYPVKKDGVFETTLVFPNLYALGIASLEFHSLFRHLSTWPDTICERVFFPESDELNWRKRTGRPIVKLESGNPMKASDLIVFSIQYVSDYIRVLDIMEMSGLILRSEQRTDKWPLIIATGLCTTANPLPLAPFIDAFIIGETESSFGPVLDTIKSFGSQGAAKAITLKRISELPGSYVPVIHGYKNPTVSIMRQWAMSDALCSQSSIISSGSAVSDTVIVEISRGCPFSCRFCLPGYISLPYRERKPEVIASVIEKYPADKKICLMGCSPDSHSGIKEIIKIAKSKGKSICKGYLRAENPQHLLEWGREMWRSSITIAPETGSDSLRKVIGKKMKNQDILETIENLPEDSSHIRLFFILGLPFETRKDRQAIVSFTKEIRQRTKLPISISLSLFIPKPWTAFQWMAMTHPRELRKYAKELIPKLEKIRKVKCDITDAREAQIEALISRGDHRIADALEDKLEGKSWSTALKEANINPDWIFTALKPGTPFAWDFLNMGFGHTRLARELTSAISANQNRLKAEEIEESIQ